MISRWKLGSMKSNADKLQSKFCVAQTWANAAIPQVNEQATRRGEHRLDSRSEGVFN